MKKLNDKGYMIVEIIVSATIAMTIAYFMMDLIVKLKEKYDYVQNDTVLMTDKTVITNEILGDLYKREIKCAKVYPDSNPNSIKFNLNNNTWLKVNFDRTNKLIKYSESNDETFDDENSDDTNNDEIFYQKKLNDLLQFNVGEIKVENNIASFIIKAETLTSKKNYGINIIIPVDGVCS